MLAGLVMPLAACADGVAPRATGEHARMPTRLETAPRKVRLVAHEAHPLTIGRARKR